MELENNLSEYFVEVDEEFWGSEDKEEEPAYRGIILHTDWRSYADHMYDCA